MLEQLAITRRTLNQPQRKFFLGNGASEVPDNTLKVMKQIINESEQTQYVRNWAEEIASTTSKDDLSVVTAIYNFLKAHTKYIHDPVSYELIRTPPASLQLIEAGGTPMLDCDDYTVLSLALLKSLGLNVGIRAASYNGNSFDHVYGLVEVNGNWIPLDLTRNYGVGVEGPGAVKLMDMTV